MDQYKINEAPWQWAAAQQHRVDFQRSLLFHATEKRTKMDSDLSLALLVFL